MTNTFCTFLVLFFSSNSLPNLGLELTTLRPSVEHSTYQAHQVLRLTLLMAEWNGKIPGWLWGNWIAGNTWWSCPRNPTTSCGSENFDQVLYSLFFTFVSGTSGEQNWQFEVFSGIMPKQPLLMMTLKGSYGFPLLGPHGFFGKMMRGGYWRANEIEGRWPPLASQNPGLPTLHLLGALRWWFL